MYGICGDGDYQPTLEKAVNAETTAGVVESVARKAQTLQRQSLQDKIILPRIEQQPVFCGRLSEKLGKTVETRKWENMRGLWAPLYLAEEKVNRRKRRWNLLRIARGI